MKKILLIILLLTGCTKEVAKEPIDNPELEEVIEEILLVGEETVEVGQFDDYIELGATFNGNQDEVVISGEVDTSVPGVYKVEYKVDGLVSVREVEVLEKLSHELLMSIENYGDDLSRSEYLKLIEIGKRGLQGLNELELVKVMMLASDLLTDKETYVQEHSSWFYFEDDFVYLDETKEYLVCYLGVGDVVIPDEVKTIGLGAFDGTNYSSVVFGENVETVSAFGFNKSKTPDVHLNEKLKYIRDYAFYKNYHAQFTIIEGVVEIGDHAFDDTYFEGDVYIPKSVTSIGMNNFARAKDVYVYGDIRRFNNISDWEVSVGYNVIPISEPSDKVDVAYIYFSDWISKMYSNQAENWVSIYNYCSDSGLTCKMYDFRENSQWFKQETIDQLIAEAISDGAELAVIEGFKRQTTEYEGIELFYYNVIDDIYEEDYIYTSNTHNLHFKDEDEAFIAGLASVLDGNSIIGITNISGLEETTSTCSSAYKAGLYLGASLINSPIEVHEFMTDPRTYNKQDAIDFFTALEVDIVYGSYTSFYGNFFGFYSNLNLFLHGNEDYRLTTGYQNLYSEALDRIRSGDTNGEAMYYGIMEDAVYLQINEEPYELLHQDVYDLVIEGVKSGQYVIPVDEASLEEFLSEHNLY